MAEIHALHLVCFAPALQEPLDLLSRDVLDAMSFVVRDGDRLIGTVRCELVGEDVWHLGLLMVPPDLWGQGIGRSLLAYAEQAAPPSVMAYQLFTGIDQERNLGMYQRAGYFNHGPQDEHAEVVRLTKER